MANQDDRRALLESEGLLPGQFDSRPSLLGGNRRNPMKNACIGRQYDELTAADSYVQGYRQAAELIALRIDEKGDWMDTLVYPFAFLWRHHIELRIKQIDHECSLRLKSSTPPKKVHGLKKLWNQARKSVEAALPNADATQLDRCEALIADFDNLDSSAQTFRYALDHKDNRNLEKDALLNIPDFNEVAATLANMLHSIHETLIY